MLCELLTSQYNWGDLVTFELSHDQGQLIDFAERENAAGGPSSPPTLWRDARDTWRRPKTAFRIYVVFT